MKIKERVKNVKIYFNVVNELQLELTKLNEAKQSIIEKQKELNKIDDEISKKKTELQLLKTELIELNDFINQKFLEDFKDCDYRVNAKNCYIVSIHGKKYVAVRNVLSTRSDWYTLATGNYNVDRYLYYDALSLDVNGKYKRIYEYVTGHFDIPYYAPKTAEEKLEYEKPILELYPELSIFVDGYIPNTYLKKIYYEVNNLSSKKLIRANEKQ